MLRQCKWEFSMPNKALSNSNWTARHLGKGLFCSHTGWLAFGRASKHQLQMQDRKRYSPVLKVITQTFTIPFLGIWTGSAMKNILLTYICIWSQYICLLQHFCCKLPLKIIPFHIVASQRRVLFRINQDSNQGCVNMRMEVEWEHPLWRSTLEVRWFWA